MSLTKEFLNRPTNISAKVVADSIAKNGKRITTFELEYNRFIHSEMMTHGALVKNSSSSRAIPISKMIEQIKLNPSTPIYWGKTQSGMQAKEELTYSELKHVKELWEVAKDNAMTRATQMSLNECHKQIANRITEPFQMIKVVCTATDFDNFFNLRIHCLSDDTEILTTQGWKLIGDVREGEKVYSLNMVNGTLEQSKVANTVSKKSEGTAISMRGQSVDLLMSLKHNVVHVEDGVLKKSLAEDLVGKRITVPKSVKTQQVFDETGYDYSEGFITGFALGNGSIYHKKQSGNRGLTVCKGGKKSEVALDKFKSACAVVYPNNKIHTYQRTSTILELDGKNVYEHFEKLLSDSSIHKKLPSNLFEQSLDFLKGVFDGLLYSDGNILNRSGGLKFYTSSKHLADGFQELCLILGYSATVSESNRIGQTSEGVDSLGKPYKITTKNVSYTCNVNLNRNEPTLKQPLEEVQYNGMFKCVTLDTNGTIYVRRNGKAVWTGNCDAQPEILMLAYLMYKAMQQSTPISLNQGEWHLPYIERERNNGTLEYFIYGENEIGYFGKKYIPLEQAIKISSSCTAQTSYRKNDASVEKADKIHDMLIKADVLHASPFAHLATPVEFDLTNHIATNLSFEPETWEQGITHVTRDGVLCSGNLQGWIQYRQLIPNNTCWNFDFDERMKMFE